jgi:hypothetical protein
MIRTSNGYNNTVARQFRCAFKNPLYDSFYKVCADGNCNSSTDTVIRWNVIVPVLDNSTGTACPPGNQPDPYLVESLAVISIIEVYASGGGGTNQCACGAYDASPQNGPNAIIIDGITCSSCGSTNLLGRKAALVK